MSACQLNETYLDLFMHLVKDKKFRSAANMDFLRQDSLGCPLRLSKQKRDELAAVAVWEPGHP
eukprot:5079488-Lingulodinium_polyedra.AAC.1